MTNTAISIDQDLWYAKRGGIVRGPFPGEYITRYILLGRIRLNDELSRTGSDWRPVAELPELFPDELQAPGNWDDYHKLVMARIRFDERIAERRSRQIASLPHEDRRKGQERRCVGNSEFFEYHLPDRNVPMREHYGQAARQPLKLLLLVAVLATLVVVYFGIALR